MTQNTLIFLVLLLLGFKVTASSEIEANKSSVDIFVNTLQNTCKIYDFMRTDNGLYLDALYSDRKRQEKNFTVSTASTGVGLISLAIAHAANLDPHAEAKVLKSLKTLSGNSTLKPERNKNGLYRHFFHAKTGMSRSEFSSIDTALLMTGVNFCRNEFSDNVKIREVCNALLNSVDWQSCKKNDLHYYMVQDKAGNPSAVTKVFNEYLLLADFCSWYNNTQPIKITQSWTRAKLNGYSALSDIKSRMLPLFTFAFPLYMSHVRANDKMFLKECLQATEADKAWWNTQLNRKFMWGTSAGASNNGYSVDHPGINPQLYLHAPVVLCFSSFNKTYQEDFMKILNSVKNIYFTYSTAKIPWRISAKNSEWRAHRVEGIDLSPLLFGAA